MSDTANFISASTPQDDLLQALLEASLDGVIICSPTGQVTSWNQAAEQMYGWSAVEALGMRLNDLLRPVLDTRARGEFSFRLQHGETVRARLVHHRKNEQAFWIETSMRAVFRDGQITSYILLCRDIQHLRQAELALAQSQTDLLAEVDWLLTVVDTMPVGVCLLDQNGAIVMANQGYEDVWGKGYRRAGSVDEYSDFKAWDAVTGVPLPPHGWAAARAVQNDERVVGQFLQIERFDGKRAFVLNGAAPIHDAQGRVTGAAVVVMDVSERVQTENALAAMLSRAELQSRLLQQRENDRLEIARDVHDGPVQTLSIALFNLHVARASAEPATSEVMGKIGEVIKQAIDELRGVIAEIRPPSAIRFGLARALQEHVDRLREQHPAITFALDVQVDPHDLPETVSVALYRVFHEATSNIMKHAYARSVQTRLYCSAEQLGMDIQDDGVGFDFDCSNLIRLTTEGHYGLAGMTERMQAAGGTLEITSSPGRGTLLRAQVPCTSCAGA